MTVSCQEACARASGWVQARNYAEALECLAAVAPGDQQDPSYLRVRAEIHRGQGELAQAYALLLRVKDQIEPDAHLYFRLGTLAMGIDHQQASQAVLAERWFCRAIELDPDFAEAHFHLGIIRGVQGQHIEGEPHFRRAAELDPTMVKAHWELAKSLFEAERVAEAQVHLDRVLQLDPDHAGARADRHDLGKVAKAGSKRSRIARFPNRIDKLTDMDRAIREFIARDDYPQVLTPASRVTTFGSCFAGNVARALREAGVDAKNTTFGEFVNSTFANREYLDWVMHERDNAVTRAIAEFHADDPNFSGDPEEHRRALAASDLVIMTVGVAPCFFDRVTKELVVPKPSSFSTRALLERCEFRTTTVDENLANLAAIVEGLAQLAPAATLVLTVSPVPLAASFEYPSAVVADCVSKSVLRVAVDQLLSQGRPRLVYWPSFEAIRWLGAYAGPMYGAEDGSTFHVSEAVIATQVDTFMDVMSGGRVRRTHAKAG